MIRVTRNDLGGNPTDGGGETLLALVHLTDTHVLDAASPARAEWVQLEADDPSFRPLLHMHRPYDALTTWALHAHVQSIAQSPVAPGSSRPFDFVLSTGDNIDNAQRNELDAYLALLSGGVAQLSAVGSAQDLSLRDSGEPWPYWCPDEHIGDTWRERGYPSVDDFIARASAPIASKGLGIPWTSVPGNHDLMRQGTALPTAELERLAIGATKSLTRPIGFEPDDPLNLFLDEPEAFSCGPGYPILADASRRAIDRREWLDAHVRCGALGYSPDHVQRGSCDTIIDTEHIRLVLLDTNHPDGDYQGSIGLAQLAWLDARLAEVDAEPDRLAILVSHHGADTLVNDRKHSPDRGLAPDMAAVVHRHPCVIAWLVGHRHINRIEPRPGASGGFWEITTSSIIDWPSQARALEVIRHVDGSIELRCTLMDHRDTADGLATLHRTLARLFCSDSIAARMSGRDIDGDVSLLLPRR